MKLGKSRLYRRIVALARRMADSSDELTGMRGELSDISESYDTERRLCVRCGGPLDNELRCPACAAQNGLHRKEEQDG